MKPLTAIFQFDAYAFYILGCIQVFGHLLFLPSTMTEYEFKLHSGVSRANSAGKSIYQFHETPRPSVNETSSRELTSFEQKRRLGRLTRLDSAK